MQRWFIFPTIYTTIEKHMPDGRTGPSTRPSLPPSVRIVLTGRRHGLGSTYDCMLAIGREEEGVGKLGNPPDTEGDPSVFATSTAQYRRKEWALPLRELVVR